MIDWLQLSLEVSAMRLRLSHKLSVTFVLVGVVMDSRSFAAGPVPVVMASGVLQKCLGIEPGAGKMMHGAATRQYCQQLPANDIYDQAGARFQAGDHAGAAKIVLRAAEAGNAVAQLRLALLYDQGDGVPQSAKAAFEWYSRAAAQGEPESQNQVGLFYELGEGVPENWDLAARLFQVSAQQGWMKGQFSLGRAYQFGIGVPQNRQLAIGWFTQAGAQGNGKGDYWAKWLRDTTNNIGFRNDTEHNIVIGGKLRFSVKLMGGDPNGITFHNSAQRVLWLAGQSNAVDRDEAEVFRVMRRSAYDDCTRAGRDNCGGRPQ
jgi:TPR repeat protein